MAVIDTFKGRMSPITKHPVVMQLMRLFNPETLQDTYAVVISSGDKVEEYSGLTHNQAMSKWESNKRWWS